jgi:hypothetical protein
MGEQVSCQHHSEAEFQAQSRLIEEIFGRAKPSFPQGKIAENDKGELAFAVALDTGKQAVVVRFAKPVDWIGLDRESALHLANLLLQKAAQLPKVAAAVILLLFLTGCVSSTIETTSPTGTKTVRKVSSFLNTIQGYTDTTIDPTGVESQTTLQNLTGDTAMVRELFNGMNQMLRTAAVLAGNTNFISSLTNQTASTATSVQTPAGPVRVKRLQSKPTALHAPKWKQQ